MMMTPSRCYCQHCISLGKHRANASPLKIEDDLIFLETVVRINQQVDNSFGIVNHSKTTYPGKPYSKIMRNINKQRNATLKATWYILYYVGGNEIPN